MKAIPQEALQHVVERPKHLDILKRYSSGMSTKIAKIAETLKIIERSKSLCYDVNEFNKEFGGKKHSRSYFSTTIKKCGIKKFRMVEDEGKIYIWSNDER